MALLAVRPACGSQATLVSHRIGDQNLQFLRSLVGIWSRLHLHLLALISTGPAWWVMGRSPYM
jgi:hypothetical protein